MPRRMRLSGQIFEFFWQWIYLPSQLWGFCISQLHFMHSLELEKQEYKPQGEAIRLIQGAEGPDMTHRVSS